MFKSPKTKLASLGAISVAALTATLAFPASAEAVIPRSVAVATVTQQGPAPLDHGFCTNWRLASFTMTRLARVPSIGTGGTTHCLMSEGVNGNHVRALQRSLVRCYGRSVGSAGIDGDWGPATTAALRFAQNQENVGVDGVYGPQTRSAIAWPTFSGDTFQGCVSFSQLTF